MEKARKWYADHITVDDSGKRPKVIVHPDRDNLDKFKVVHGTTTNKWSGDAKPVFHAWVQMGDMIFDDQTKHTKPNGIDEATYYDVFSAEPKNEYTAKQAIAKCSLKGTEGPWDAKSIAKMKARDAWLGENKVDKVNIKQLVKETLEAALNEEPRSDKAAALRYRGPQYFADTRSRVDALGGIESEADGLARGADVMIAAHERGTRLDGKAVGTVLKNKANKIKDLVQQHRAEMEGPHRGVADKPDDVHPVDEARSGRQRGAFGRPGSPKRRPPNDWYAKDFYADRRAARKTMTTEPDESANAGIANKVEDFISQQLIKVAGPVGQWTPEHLETFEQINNLLNVLFPSGK
jgi:hypothetical protein